MRHGPRWPTMRAFALPSFYDGRVRVNVRGRAGGGLVGPEDYAAVLDEVMGAALGLLLPPPLACATAELQLRFRRAAPTETTLVVVATVVEEDHPHYHVEATLGDDDGVLTTARARWPAHGRTPGSARRPSRRGWARWPGGGSAATGSPCSGWR